MTLLPGDWAHWGGLAFSFTGKKQPLPGLPGSPTATRTHRYPIPMSLLTSVTSPFPARRPDMPSRLGPVQPWCLADASMPPAGLWLSMLVCVSMLCTCFVVYISRMDWRKAAEEVTHAPHCVPPAGTSLVLWLGSQQDQAAPQDQPCPGSPAKPSAPVFGTVAISVDSPPPHMCTRQPQSVSVHLVPTWAGDMKLKADRVTEIYPSTLLS